MGVSRGHTNNLARATMLLLLPTAAAWNLAQLFAACGGWEGGDGSTGGGEGEGGCGEGDGGGGLGGGTGGDDGGCTGEGGQL